MTSVRENGVVEFWFFRRDVSGVQVVGDFAAPCDRGIEMTGSPDGWWRATVALDAGEYRFRYVADGAWFPDYASNGVEVTRLGINSLLVVPERRGEAAQANAARMVA
jgi:1,4-alpha-glucan branching enzyme